MKISIGRIGWERESRLITRKRSRSVERKRWIGTQRCAHLYGHVMATPEELYRDDDKGDRGRHAELILDERARSVYIKRGVGDPVR